MTDARQIDVAAWAEWHAVHAPWCDPTRCHSHDMRLNGPDLVNGKPAGPSAALTVPGVAALFAREQDAWGLAELGVPPETIVDDARAGIGQAVEHRARAGR